MNNTLQGALAFFLMICLAVTAHAEADSKIAQDAEFKFRVQMTSALNNDPKAQFLVAEMYEQGLGTPQNLRMAQLWYSKSANQGYKPAVEKLASWQREKQKAETSSSERAAEQQRRQAEAEAAAAKAEQERADLQKRQQAEAMAAAAAKAAKERAEQQMRRQAEAEAAAAAKAAKERDQQKRLQAEAEAAAVAAAKADRERAEEQKRRQAEAEAAANAAKSAQAVEIVPVVKEKRAESDQPKNKTKAGDKGADKGSAEFRANPCKSPTAKFTSTCQ